MITARSARNLKLLDYDIVYSTRNSGFSDNHSTGYSMNGYMVARLRYYYPLEFTTAYLNRAENEEDIQFGTLLAKERGIEILPPKFRYSKAKYHPDKETNSIYKGLHSIKFINEECANYLYSLRENTYNSFMELIFQVKNESGINFKQLKILTTLNFFSEFGKNGKLLALINAYENRLKNKNLKQSTKEKRLAELIELEKSTENKSIDIQSQIKAEIEYLGYESTIVEKLPDSVYIITNIDDKSTKKLRMYRLKDGLVEEMKCYKKDFNNNPAFGEYSIIKMTGYKNRDKVKKVNGEWIPTGEKQKCLSSWTVIK